VIPEQALRLAGDHAHLVHRPTGRLHVYTGPLTPSGRYVPRSARTVCRARTRRLEVATHRVSSLNLDATLPGLCRRCSARLESSASRAEQRHTPNTRAEFLAAYRDLDAADLAFALTMATTPAEVDAAAHLTLALFDVAGTLAGFTDHGRNWRPLHAHVVDARTRVHGYPDSHYRAMERADAQTAAARDQAVARRREIHADNEARIARLGIATAKPARPRARTNRGA